MKISFWTGAAYEPWGPPSIDTGGIGGSETAAIHMARQLSRLGHQVTMFGQHEGFEGDWWHTPLDKPVATNNVDYVDYKKALADPKLLACDVFVSSRDKRILRLKPDCRTSVLWVHDVHVGDDWENEVGLFDRIYCLSKWHKGYFEGVYPHMPPEKVRVTRNGIDVDRFEPMLTWSELAKRKKPKFVYSSSPDRGLDVLLDMWPDIRKMRDDSEDAELHVYYGFENWRKLNENAGNKKGLLAIDFMKARVDSMSDQGVVYHGRVGQAEIAKAHMDAMVWAYPTMFAETYCITALEAQAAGVIPVTTNLAALVETARLGLLVDPSPTNKSPRYKAAFLLAVEGALKEWVNRDQWLAGMAPKIAFECRDWAKEQSWAEVARSWSEDFEQLLALKGRS
jgi:glycosyltransferase involved in cell wall biosynthesis